MGRGQAARGFALAAGLAVLLGLGGLPPAAPAAFAGSRLAAGSGRPGARVPCRAFEVADFAAAVARQNAGFCDPPFAVNELVDGDDLELRIDPGGMDPQAAPEQQWRRFWGDLRRQGRSDDWHEEVYWRVVRRRGQNGRVFAAQVARAWSELRSPSGESLLEHEGEPVVGCLVLHGHLRVEDLLKTTPKVFLVGAGRVEFPTYGTVGYTHRVALEMPTAARGFGIDTSSLGTARDVLTSGLNLCLFLDEDPDHVSPHVWCALQTPTRWVHVDLCGVAFGCSGRTPEGWPLHTFETQPYGLAPCREGQFGDGKSAVGTEEETLEALHEDALRHRHFGFIFRKDYPAREEMDPLEAEEAARWLEKAPDAWLSEERARAVRAELEER